jgi:hypothetical protein
MGHIMHSSKAKLGALTLAVVTAALASISISAGAATASTTTASPLDHFSTFYPIPNTPVHGPTNVSGYVNVDGVAGGDALPVYPGTLGNPTNIFQQTYPTYGTEVGHSTSVITDPNGSTAWGTVGAVQTADGVSTSQRWFFQLVGTTGVATANSGSKYAKLPVYKIINYAADGSHMCLEAAGANPTNGAAVDLYPCDINYQNQPNQLWVVGNMSLWSNLINADGTPVTPSDTQLSNGPVALVPSLEASDTTYSLISSTAIVNVATIEAQGHRTAGIQTPALSAEVWEGDQLLLSTVTDQTVASWAIRNMAVGTSQAPGCDDNFCQIIGDF